MMSPQDVNRPYFEACSEAYASKCRETTLSRQVGYLEHLAYLTTFEFTKSYIGLYIGTGLPRRPTVHCRL